MGRKRKNKSDHWLPKRVYRGKTQYEFHPKEGGSVSLCPLDSQEYVVWMAYRTATGEIVKEDSDWLAEQYFKSSEFAKKRPRTQKDYRAYWKKLSNTFGRVMPSRIKPAHVRRYMDLRGRESEAMANKEVKLLKIVMRYGAERGMLSENPCRHIKFYPEQGRDRYITDQEYEDFYNIAEPTLKVFMELAYICAARGQDLRKILMSDITDEGLMITQQKTGKKQVKLWNARLRNAVKLAKEIRAERNPNSIFLIVSSAGSQYSTDGLKSLWRRAKSVAGYVSFTFHDLKAKGISDFEGDKQNFSGHKDRRMMERYNRTPDKTPVIDFRGK